MNAFDFSSPGGMVMAALLALSLTLYFLLADRLLELWSHRRPRDVTAGMRRVALIRALTVLSPMLGLLGTVCGIIQTFHGVSGSAGSVSIPQGIHAALYTTEYGLLIAIPAYILQRLLDYQSTSPRSPVAPEAPEENA